MRTSDSAEAIERAGALGANVLRAGSSVMEPSGRRLRLWAVYAAVGLAPVAVLALVGVVVWGGAVADALWRAGLLGYVVQLVAFAFLLLAPRRPAAFLTAWFSGTALRVAALVGLAIWLTRTGAEARAAWLLGLVSVFFVLMLMEAVFLRREARRG